MDNLLAVQAGPLVEPSSNRLIAWDRLSRASTAWSRSCSTVLPARMLRRTRLKAASRRRSLYTPSSAAKPQALARARRSGWGRGKTLRGLLLGLYHSVRLFCVEDDPVSKPVCRSTLPNQVRISICLYSCLVLNRLLSARTDFV